MGYRINKLANASGYPGNPPATITIVDSDPKWAEAYTNWLSGKNPTDSPEWKKGVFASTVLLKV